MFIYAIKLRLQGGSFSVYSQMEQFGFLCMSPVLKLQFVGRLFMQTPNAMLSRLNCDVELRHGEERQEEIAF